MSQRGALAVDTAEANGRVAAALLATLEQNGLTDVVLCPGSRNTPLTLAAVAHPELRCHQLLDERVAGFFALGLAREQRRATAVITTSGSAAANLLPAVVEAGYGDVPLLLLTADRPPDLHACGAPQTMDQHRLFGDHVRSFFQLAVPETTQPHEAAARDAAASGWAKAHGNHPGPVQLNIPLAEPLWQLGATATSTTSGPQVLTGLMQLAPQTAHSLAQRLAKPKTAIICGPQIYCPEMLRALRQLARATGWPLLADGGSGLRHGDDGLALIYSDLYLRDTTTRARLRAEQLLCFGGAPTSKATNTWLAGHQAEEVVLFDSAPRLRNPSHTTSLLVHADPHATATTLTSLLSKQGVQVDPRWRQRWQQAEQGAAHSAREALADGLWEGAVARTIVEVLPARSLLHAASSMPIRDLDSLGGRSTTELDVRASRGLNGIDGTVSTFWGEAVASAGKGTPALLLVGDLALQHDVGGLLALASAPPERSTTIVMLDNGGGGIFEFLPIKDHPSAFLNHFITPQGIDLKAVGSSLGLSVTTVGRRNELRPALETALGRPGLDLVSVQVNRQENRRRHQDLWHGVVLRLGAEA